MAERETEPREGYIAIGRVVRPWGLHGDVKVESLTDFPERFLPGKRVWIGGTERTVERSRTQKGETYLKLSGIEGPDEAETLRGRLLEVPESDLRPLPEGGYYHFQLEGLPVRTTEGEALGTVHEVLEPGGNAVLVVRGDRGEVLIPFIEDVIRAVDLDAGAITVDLIEGLLPEEKPHRARATTPYQRRKARRPRRTPPSAPPPASS